MEALNDNGFDFIKVQIETLFKNMPKGDSNQGFSEAQFDQIKLDCQELKAKLDNIAQNGTLDISKLIPQQKPEQQLPEMGKTQKTCLTASSWMEESKDDLEKEFHKVRAIEGSSARSWVNWFTQS